MILTSDYIESVARTSGVSLALIHSDSRDRRITRLRQAMMFVLRRKHRMPSPQVARYLNRKDHTTILFGDRAFENYLRHREELAIRYYKIAIRQYIRHKEACVLARDSILSILDQQQQAKEKQCQEIWD